MLNNLIWLAVWGLIIVFFQITVYATPQPKLLTKIQVEEKQLVNSLAMQIYSNNHGCTAKWAYERAKQFMLQKALEEIPSNP